MENMNNFGSIATPETLEIVSIIEDLRSVSSTNAKKDILEKNKDNEGLKTILELTYNPFKKYKVTEKSLIGGTEDGFTYGSLRMLTYTLANKNINNELREIVNNFLEQADEEIKDLYKCVLLKDLKIGVNVSTINKIWNDLIPTGETGLTIKPMLASKFDFDKPPKGTFAVTEKLDGIRCIAICTSTGVELYTRQGKLIKGCAQIEIDLRLIRALWGSDFVLDGELLADGCSYEDVYKETTKRVKNDKPIKMGIHFTAFDILSLSEFENLKCTTQYYKRMETLLKLNEVMKDVESVEMINILYIGEDMERILQLLDEYRLKGAEGLMVNLMDSVYEFKRSKAILKVKVMQTVDLKVTGFEEGQGRNAGKLGAMLVDYKGNIVGVGSGFSDYQREYIWNNQDEFLDKIVEVQYFEETKNKEGQVSLRFPVFKHKRDDKTEPSYN